MHQDDLKLLVPEAKSVIQTDLKTTNVFVIDVQLHEIVRYNVITANILTE